MAFSRRRFLHATAAGSAALLAPGLGRIVRAVEADPDAFTLIALPDTQNYSESYPKIYTSQTKWIVDNHDKLRIAFVAHEGDVTNHNHRPEWVNAEKSMRLLDGVVPYCVNVGNHDLGPDGQTKDRSSLIDEFFPVDRYKDQPWWGGALDGSNHNSYQFFEAAKMRFLVINLEFGPRDRSLEWANEIVSKHEDCRTILVTHAYMSNDDTRISATCKFGPIQYHIDGADGDKIWDTFVRRHRNVFLVLSGHVFVAGPEHDWKYDSAWTETGLLTSTNDAGRPTHQILADYQGRPNGGDGWLRVMTFQPNLNRIDVTTYSPWLDKHLVQPHNQFPLAYAMRPR
ncbi:metallophosphatase [Planctomycetales bacterium ZRK34]|nr:metallophosphatase [Planctomycetales bacterium ZRK34]